VRLEDDALFFRQPCLAACSARLRWENGYIPGLREQGPPIMHVRGQGILALRYGGPLWSCAVTRATPLRAFLPWILAWTEEVVVQLLGHGTGRRMVQFEGQGVVLLAAGETRGP